MKTSLTLVAGLFAMCLLLAAGPLHAAKAPKVDICHFDADEGTYSKKSVSGNAQQPHLNHGDLLPGVDNGNGELSLDADCLPVVPTPVLAWAYIDVNSNGTYDADTDIDIAQLLDTNTDGSPGPGDEVLLGQYPTTFDPCPLPSGACTNVGDYVPGPHLVSTVIISTNVNIIVTSGNHIYRWDTNTQSERFKIDCPGSCTTINDFADDASFDRIKINAGGDPDPVPAVTIIQVPSPVDDYFINVEFPGTP